MTTLTFDLPTGETRTVQVSQTINAGYAGRNSAQVRAHIDELAELGVPGPTNVPTMYPVSPYLAQQVDAVDVPHDRTSGEAEWGLIIDSEGDVLLTAACDHTDRALEVHGVAWSKNASPDVLARQAWRLVDVRDHLDELTLRAWVGDGVSETLIQDSTCAALLTPDYWLDVLRSRDIAKPGTVLISGTVPMVSGVNQFAQQWRVELADPTNGKSIELSYTVRRLPEAID